MSDDLFLEIERLKYSRDYNYKRDTAALCSLIEEARHMGMTWSTLGVALGSSNALQWYKVHSKTEKED